MLGRVLADVWQSLILRRKEAATPADGAPGLLEAANAAIGAGDVRRAVEYAELALEQDADCHDARLLLAKLYLHGRYYTQVIADIHQFLRPRSYVEIGVDRGESLRLARAETLALGVDPNPAIQFELSPNTRVFAETSDRFFATHDVRADLGGLDVDLAFIDGMHHFENALRDFVNLEPLCGSGSTILVHDCFPLDRASAQRERQSVFWSGDVWRLVVLLKKHRPDLRIHTIATPPTGLAIIRGLDPSSRSIGADLERLIEETMAIDYSYLRENRAAKLNRVPNEWDGIRALLEAR